MKEVALGTSLDPVTKQPLVALTQPHPVLPVEAFRGFAQTTLSYGTAKRIDQACQSLRLAIFDTNGRA
jgi:hypothetical protein